MTATSPTPSRQVSLVRVNTQDSSKNKQNKELFREFLLVDIIVAKIWGTLIVWFVWTPWSDLKSEAFRTQKHNIKHEGTWLEEVNYILQPSVMP